MNEEKSVAILTRNLKREKKKPSNLLDVALACRSLMKRWSLKKMSEFFHVSAFQLRQIDKINELNVDVRQLVGNGRMGIETAYQLWRLGSSKQSQAARIVVELRMTAHEVRQFVYLIQKNPDKSMETVRKLFEETRSKKIDLVVLPLPAEVFRGLREQASKKKMGVHDFALKVLEDYLNAHKA